MAGTIVTVSQLSRFVKALLEEQKPLADLLVKGEVANLSYRSASGHLYFTLCDGESSLRCVIFSRFAQKLEGFPEEGSLVVVRGTVNLYERDGSFQVIGYDVQELGAGIQQKSLEEIKKRLAADGLFDEAKKRPFPPFPAAVGVITSQEGAALQDIISTFRQLNPLVKLIIYPATVQGGGGAVSVIAALETLGREKLCQSCVIARGGGSSEDLSVFNDEALVRAVAACPVPVVSAVGHEVDYSLTDFAADARAATPTAACRLLSAPSAQLAEQILRQQRAFYTLASRRLEQKRGQAERLSLLLSSKSPEAALKKNRQTTLFLVKSIEMRQTQILERLRQRTHDLVGRMELVSPSRVLKRGYSITSGGTGVITSCTQVASGDRLVTRFQDGTVTSTVLAVGEEE